jgi:hypothetical protein
LTLFARVVARAERWIEHIDRERDRLAGGTTWALLSEIEQAFIRERLATLERERAEAVKTLETLERLRHRPEVMFAQRPVHEPGRMLSVPLRRKADRKEIA